MRRVLKATGLLALLLVAIAIAAVARLRGRASRFERARIDRVDDVVTPLQRHLFAQGCTSVRVVPMRESMVTGPHAAGSLWIECWSEASCEQLLELLPVATWPVGSDVRLNGPKGSWCLYTLQGGRADLVGGSNFYSPHLNIDRRPLSARVESLLRALFQ